MTTRADRGAAATITEKQWLAQVAEIAGLCRWTTYHGWVSVHSPAGWPDLVLCRPPRLLFAELKSERGKTTPAQDHWLGLLGQCPGIEVFVWRPSDLDDVVRVLR